MPFPIPQFPHWLLAVSHSLFPIPPFPHWLLAVSTISHFHIFISPFPSLQLFNLSTFQLLNSLHSPFPVPCSLFLLECEHAHLRIRLQRLQDYLLLLRKAREHHRHAFLPEMREGCGYEDVKKRTQILRVFRISGLRFLKLGKTYKREVSQVRRSYVCKEQ